MNETVKCLATVKGMPIEKAISFEPSEIKGDKPNVKLSVDGQEQESVLMIGKS